MIKVVGSSNKKGDSFVLLLKTLLDHMGFEDIICNVREAGKEIDLRARQKVTKAPMIGEAKAKEEKVSSPEINKFLGVFSGEQSSNRRLSGLFISLAGFSDDAKRLRETWDTTLQDCFLLLDGCEVENSLVVANLCMSKEELQRQVSERFLLEQGERYLLWSEHDLRWVQIFTSEETPTHFAVFTAFGKETPRWICEELQCLDPVLGDLELLDFEAEDKVLQCLMDCEAKTAAEIAEKMKLAPGQVELCLTSLRNLAFVEKDMDKWAIADSLDTYLNLARRFIANRKGVLFLRKKYGEAGINVRLLKHVQMRIGIDFESDFETAVSKILKISPSALRQALFGDTSFFATGKKQIEQNNLGEEAMEIWRQSTLSTFLSSLLEGLLSDLRSDGHSEFMGEKRIKLVLHDFTLTLAAMDGLYLKAQGGADWFVAKVAGPLKAGQIVSASNPDLFIERGTLLMHAQRHDEAIKDFDKAINGGCQGRDLAAAWNNKGLCLERMGNIDGAIIAFQQAGSAAPDLKEPLSNLERLRPSQS